MGTFSKRDILYLIFKRKGLILSIFILTTVLVAVGSYIVPLQYEALSEVYIKRDIPPIPFMSPSYFYRSLERNAVITSEVELIKSKAVIEKAVDILMSRGKGEQKENRVGKTTVLAKFKLIVKSMKRKKNDVLISLGLISPGSAREQMVSRVKKIKVKPVVNADIIKISYQHTDPVYATEVVNTVTNAYLEQHLELVKRPGTYELYDDQTKKSEDAIKDLDEEIISFKEKRSIISIEDQKRLKLEELVSKEGILNRTRIEDEVLRKKIEILKNQIRSQPEKVIGSKAVERNPQIDHLNAKLLDLEIEKVRLLEKFTPQSQKIKEIDSAIESVQKQLSQESLTIVATETVINNKIREGLIEALQKAETDLNANIAQESALSHQINELEKELQQMDKYTSEIEALSRAKVSAEESHLRYIKQREEARVAGDTGINITDVRVVRWASVPELPITSRLFLSKIGALMGLIAGFFLALVVEWFDHSLHNKEDIEYYLNLPLIASIPETNFNKKLLSHSALE